jgi:hypothetical protein
LYYAEGGQRARPDPTIQYERSLMLFTLACYRVTASMMRGTARALRKIALALWIVADVFQDASRLLPS